MRSNPKNILVTGGAGFIGSAFIRYCFTHGDVKVVNLDLLTYAADLSNLAEIEKDPRYHFVLGDISNEELVEKVCLEHEIDTIVHFAAESHVDRSIEGPVIFSRTNIEGTIHLLEVVRRHPSIHFHHVSTDEVYGALGASGSFSETSHIQPNSPYAASKAASDHFVRAYANTYGISTTISHCSNNYGPCQNTEKFIPRMLYCLAHKKPLPVYGRGMNVRDWLFVDDHVEAIWLILQKGRTSEVYDIGGGFEAPNIEIVHMLIDEYRKHSAESHSQLEELIEYVEDRLGHDFRYSIDASKIRDELGWVPRHTFAQGLSKTVEWYLANKFALTCGS